MRATFNEYPDKPHQDIGGGEFVMYMILVGKELDSRLNEMTDSANEFIINAIEDRLKQLDRSENE